MALYKDLVDLPVCHPPFRTSVQVIKYKRHLLAIVVSDGQDEDSHDPPQLLDDVCRPL